MRLFLKIFQQILVFGGIGVAIFVVLYVFVFDGNMDKMNAFKSRIFSRGKGKKEGHKKEGIKKKSIKSTETKSSKKKKEKGKPEVLDSREILDFDDIKVFSPDNPVGLIIKKGKKEFVGVVEVHGINYNLLSFEERESLEESFARLLNGIDYPIQIYIQSKKVDIESYDLKYSTRIEEIKKSLDRTKDKLEFAKDSNESEETLFELQESLARITRQYNYALQIRDWIIQRCKAKSMLERKYYIVLTHTHNKLSFKEELTEEELLHNAFFDISNKSSSLISALQRANLDGHMLTGFELADLLYRSYNKADSEYYKLNKALQSRFSHLCTTSKPVELKKLERAAKNIEEEIEQIRSKAKEKVGA